MSFSEKIKQVRSQLKLSQEDLGHEWGASRWENGNYNPSRLAKKAFDEFCVKHEISF